MTYKQHFVFIFFLFYISSINCQEQQLQDSDSLAYKDFLYLETKFNTRETSDADAKLYAAAYLKKAKRINDTKKIIDGYYYKGLAANDSLKTIYIDSLINLSKKHSDHYRMEDILVMKASTLYLKRSYKKAIDLYIEAQTYAKQSNNTNMLFNIEYNMGLIYNLIGDPENGLNVLKKSLQSFEKLNTQSDWMRLHIISGLVTSYRKQGMYDSVSYHTKKAIKQTHGKPKYKRLYHLFLLKEGMTLYAIKEYLAAMDSIQKTIPHFKQKGDDSNLLYAYYYLGKIYLEMPNSAAAIHNFKKVDSISQKVNYLFPETRATYEILIDHYKSKGNAQKQLTYIERLLRLDSIVHDKELYLTKHISENYSTPRLVSDKQQIITSLQKKERFYFVSIICAVILIILIGGFLVFHYVQRNVYKKRFELLLKNQEENNEIIVPNASEISKNDLAISEDIVATLLKNLADFKENNEFLTPNITLLKLAKRLKTNHTYLSRIINMYEGKSFNSFINNLRIEYTIKRLQTDAVFRKYTIDAIAEESGFSNTRTFSRAFQRKTNLNPSYFIKNLNASYSE